MADEKLRIIHVIPSLAGGGAEILVGHIALEQLKRGFKVEIILLEPEHKTYANYPLKEELEKQVPIHRVNTRILLSYYKDVRAHGYEEYQNIIARFNPHIIHSHLFTAEIISRYQTSKNIKYFTHCHDNMSQFSFRNATKSLKRKLTDWLEKNWIVKKYKECNNTFIAISEHTYDYFKKNLPGPLNQRIHLLHNAINTRLFSANPCAEIKENDPVKLVSIGNLFPKKGHSFLIDVVKILTQKGFNVELDILGFGILENDLKQKIESLGLSKAITLRGNVKNVNHYLSKAHIYVHSAYYEPFGLVLVEAMASKLPIVCTDGKGNRSLVKDGHNGYYIMERDEELFAEKIIHLITHPDLRIKMGENSLEFSEEFTIESYVDKLTRIYTSSPHKSNS